MRKSNIEDSIECLLEYAIDTELIEEADRIQKRNEIAALLGVELGSVQTEAWRALSIFSGSGAHNMDKYRALSRILGRITDYAAETGLIPRDTITYRDLFDTRVMGLLTPRQSEVIRRFTEIRSNQSTEKATEYFYSMCQASNYIRTDRVRKNRKWSTPTEFGELAITVNLSKPEKDPRDIAEAAAAEESQYPRCVLCVENVGYTGTASHPARQNLRAIPVTLGNEPWYFQYSPYVYYNEHCIVLSEEHRPLVVDRAALNRMLDFVDAFPHYFLGSNAGLPIVGGSILNHDHYQGGRETFPLDEAPFERVMVHPDYPDITAGTLKWCMSAIRLVGSDRKNLLGLASLIMEKWHDYRDESAGIVPYTPESYGQDAVNKADETAQTGKPNEPGKNGEAPKACEYDTAVVPETREACKCDTDVATEYGKIDRGNQYTGKQSKTANTGRCNDHQVIRHNAITPTVRRDPQGNYIVNLVFRNNRTTPSHPHGLFHPRPELQHIKKENIGVIEVMGMAILPGRLQKELDEIGKILCGEAPVPVWDSQEGLTPAWNSKDTLEGPKQEDGPIGYAHLDNQGSKHYIRKNWDEKTKNQNPRVSPIREHILYKHRHWIAELISKYGTKLSPEQAQDILRAEVGNRFLEVLLDAAVFKQDAQGRAAFQQFVNACGFVC